MINALSEAEPATVAQRVGMSGTDNIIVRLLSQYKAMRPPKLGADVRKHSAP